jgi:uncharacterized protein Yka (UPF0111/DUF47 family)
MADVNATPEDVPCKFCESDEPTTRVALCAQCAAGFCLSCEACKEQHFPELERLRAKVAELEADLAEAV